MVTLLALLPIALLIVLMLALKMRGDKSALCALATAAFLALMVVPRLEGFAPYLPQGYSASGVGWAFVEGVLKAVLPILLIIMMAIYSYNVLLESKQIEVIKAQFTRISSDRRLQVLLIVWGFGGLLEGMAGFGTAVAIPAAILIGLGFAPGFSALVSLIANSVATGFGAVGVPIITLAKEAFGQEVTTPELQATAGDVILQLSALMFLVPFVILYLTDSRRSMLLSNLLLSLSVGGISLAVQFASAYFIGAETPAILGSLACILFILIYARLREPRRREEGEVRPQGGLRAWAVYGCILLFILIASPLGGGVSLWLRTHGVSEIKLPIYTSGEIFRFGWLSNAALMLLLGSFVGGLLQGLRPIQLLRLLGQTIWSLRFSATTIISLVAMSAIMSYSGMITAIAHTLVETTGGWYPLFAPLVGALGTFATGSDTSSNILFGRLQAQVADQLSMDRAWLAAANTAGATGGKIISPQSIAIATAACGQGGKEGAILRSALPYALLYVLIVGITVYCCAALALPH